MAINKTENPGCLSKIFPFLRQRPSAVDSPIPQSVPKELPYRLRDDFLSPAEFSFYKVLTNLLGTHFVVQSKVRLADIFYVARPNENRAFFNQISAKHLDFLVCDPVTMHPLLGIELDDSSHQRSDRQERDDFVVEVFKVAKLPLLQIPARREYNQREIAALVVPILKEKLQSAAAPLPETSTQSAGVPVCPKCGIPMILRTVSQGENYGKQFYGCRNYPSCQQMKPFMPSKS